ncbi:MAG: 6-phosphofructokinase [Gammaproteobacteria bacterium]|nr:MAG: 6-phosphofructokinase [Gammaproteobacteria bacterium]RKZ45368.1 MAG: 6-phosphofructokinase [Gammaproteobacteria bacterium]RKZ74802.1 MAG: 6-phosphofructokinase [Gammaproteobacteria bacterium]
MSKSIGILTAGGDSPGLNAAIRAIGKTALASNFGMQVVGFRDGFRGLVENRTMRLDQTTVSGILTLGGTLLGTSRDKPHRMPMGDKELDMTETVIDTYHKNHLDVLVCIGGGGTHKNAYRLAQKGLNVITLPKTIDNDLAMTDTTIGFDSALGIATEAIDRLHSTAHSHHRIIVVGIMGHNAGWLALGAGIAGGAHVILIPEMPYDVQVVADAIRQRQRQGKNFSLVAIAEGALSKKNVGAIQTAIQTRETADTKKEKKEAKIQFNQLKIQQANNTLLLTKQLEQLTGLESRLTILGHLQRGGTPSSADRLLATQLGTACVSMIHEGIYGVMAAKHGQQVEPVPLEDVVGKRKTVPLDHPWIETALRVGVSFGN